MRILMHLNPSTGSIPGGHARQAWKTAEYLERLGLDACVTHEPSPSLDEFDLVHAFGVAEEVIRHAKDHAKPVVVSPIYWSYRYEQEYARVNGRWSWLKANWRQRVRAAGAALRGGYEGVRRAAGFWTQHAALGCALRMADMLLPNANAEADDLVRECGVDPSRVRFVPNAVDATMTQATPDLFVKTHGIKDFVLCVGRVEPRKNQLRLIRCLRGAGKSLVIVDPVHPHHAVYRRQCRAAMTPNMLYLQQLDEEMLQSAYAAARVHVLASFYETTGLASLEAALAGCNVVVNEQAHTREYFGDDAWYCDPARAVTIRSAIDAAFVAPFQEPLRDRILRHYTWEQTAKATLSAYQGVLRRDHDGIAIGPPVRDGACHSGV